MKKISRILFCLLIISPIALPISAVSTNEIRKMCSKAKDYWECERSMKGIGWDLRNYGPIKIDWAVWRKLNGSLVAKGLNSSGKGFYLAINCKSKKINVTGKNGLWKGWSKAYKDFELKLIEDLCN